MRLARYMPGRAVMLAVDASSLGGMYATLERLEPFERVGANAVVTIRGPLTQRDEWCFDNYDAVRARFDAALASDAKAIILRLDSPGGEVGGCFELAAEMRGKAKAAGRKLVAYVDGTAASAAYALACAASEIYVPPSGVVGSIGIIQPIIDQTAMDRAMGVAFAFITSGARKADGNPHQAMSEASVAAIQRQVDEMATLFFELVAESRGTKAEAIAGLEAATFIGASAVKAGLADAVLTFDGLLAMVASGTTTAQVGAEERMDRKARRAALRALAASDDEKDKEYATAQLAAMGDEADDEKDEGDKKEASAESESDDAPPPKKDDDKDTKAAASAASGVSLALQVQTLSARIAAREAAEERSKLMATRPDFVPEVAAFLAKQPLATVRAAVKEFPKGPPAPKSPVQAARAAITAPATASRGEGQGDPAAQSDHDVADMDRRMGRASPMNAIRNEGTRQYIGVMTPAQARAELATRSKAVAK